MIRERDIFEAPVQQAISEISASIGAFSVALSEACRAPSEIYVLGSLGRRLAMSGAGSLQEYADRIRMQTELSPRRHEDGNYEVDVAVPRKTLDWNRLREICYEATHGSSNVVLEPHVIDISDGVLYPVCENVFQHIPFGVDVKRITTNSQNSFFVLDGISAFIYELSWFYFRQKDMHELVFLARHLLRNGDLSNRQNQQRIGDVIKSNPLFRDPKTLLKMPYWYLMPDDFKRWLGGIKGNKPQDAVTLFEKPVGV